MEKMMKRIAGWFRKTLGIKRAYKKSSTSGTKRIPWSTRKKMSETHKRIWSNMTKEQRSQRKEKMQLGKLIKAEMVGS